MFWKRGFAGQGFRTLLAKYRTRRTIRPKREDQLKKWAKEDRAWAEQEQERELLILERDAEEVRWEKLEREWKEIKAKWPTSLIDSVRAQNEQWKLDFRVELATVDASTMLEAMRKVGSPERIEEATAYLTELARSMGELQNDHISRLRAGVDRSQDGQLWRSAGQGPGTSEGIHSHGV